MRMREYREADFTAIQGISCSYESDSYYRVTKGDWSYTVEKVPYESTVKRILPGELLWVGGTDYMIFIIEEQTEMIGYMEMVYHNKNHILEITRICMKEGHRKKGIGRKLLKASKGYARFKKARVILAAIESANDPAIQFFTKEGFRFCGVNELYFSNQPFTEQQVGLYFGFQFE